MAQRRLRNPKLEAAGLLDATELLLEASTRELTRLLRVDSAAEAEPVVGPLRDTLIALMELRATAEAGYASGAANLARVYGLLERHLDRQDRRALRRLLDKVEHAARPRLPTYRA